MRAAVLGQVIVQIHIHMGFTKLRESQRPHAGQHQEQCPCNSFTPLSKPVVHNQFQKLKESFRADSKLCTRFRKIANWQE